MKNINICNLILQKLKEEERSIAWLARQVGCNSDNLRKTLNNNQDLYTDLLYRISIALKEDFFACYSEKLKRKILHTNNAD